MLALMLASGLILLVAGGDFFVRGSVGIAERLKVSPLVIGLTLVGFGTSTPELLTSLIAALKGSPGIALGNVVGSNTCNILLILGAAALIYPLATERKALMRDGAVMLGASLVCLALAMAGVVSRPVGFLMVAALATYIVVVYRLERRDNAAREHAAKAEALVAEPHPRALFPLLAMTAGGLAATILGAHWLVNAAIDLAAMLGVSDTIIGLTVVALGTSLPELVTSVVAALRRQSDIALGNILGSNIYNVLGILGTTALVRPVAVPAEILRFDIWVMLGATALLLIFARSGDRICRAEGGTLLGLYALYIGVLAFA